MAKKVLFIGLVWPEPTSSAAGTRIIQLVNLFLSQGDEVHFASAAVKNNFSYNFEQKVKCHPIALNNDSFNVLVRQINPTVVVFDRFMVEEQYGWRVQQECPDALLVLDTEDLHYLRKGRQVKGATDFYTDTTKREIAAVLRCDLSLIISEFELNLLTGQFKIDPSILHYLPFLEDKISPSPIKNWKSFDERKDFVFIGNYLHEPNWQTLLLLKKEIWPLLSKQLPQASLYIYGAYASDKVVQLNNIKQRFLVKGRVENAREGIASHRVLLAPLTFGAGIKGKLIDAMQTGTPSVTSSVGAEAMNGNLAWAGCIADDNVAFVNAAVNLYTNENQWKIAQQNGIEIINQRYAKELFEPEFNDRIIALQNNLAQHRQQNFIGEILKHHTLQSTKYLSLWIEEKNK